MSKHFTDIQKQAYLAEYYESNLTQVEFCKQKDLSSKTLNRWVHLDKSSTSSNLYQQKETSNPGILGQDIPRFIPVHLKDDAHQDESSNTQMPVLSDRTLCLRIHQFELDFFIDLASDHGQLSLKNIIQALT